VEALRLSGECRLSHCELMLDDPSALYLLIPFSLGRASAGHTQTRTRTPSQPPGPEHLDPKVQTRTQTQTPGPGNLDPSAQTQTPSQTPGPSRPANLAAETRTPGGVGSGPGRGTYLAPAHCTLRVQSAKQVRV
jgi:hypothetical protein